MSLGYDCVMIPGATKASNKNPVPNSICGNGKGLVTLAAGTTSATVCSKFFYIDEFRYRRKGHSNRFLYL